MTWKIKPITGPFEDQEVIIDQDKIIGRDASAVDIVLQGGRISRRHAKLLLIDDQLWIKDLNSANGTFVNGSRVEGEQQLKVDDELQFDVVHFAVLNTVTVDVSAAPVLEAPIVVASAELPVEAPAVIAAAEPVIDVPVAPTVVVPPVTEQPVAEQPVVRQQAEPPAHVQQEESHNSLLKAVGVVILILILAIAVWYGYTGA